MFSSMGLLFILLLGLFVKIISKHFDDISKREEDFATEKARIRREEQELQEKRTTDAADHARTLQGIEATKQAKLAEANTEIERKKAEQQALAATKLAAADLAATQLAATQMHEALTEQKAALFQNEIKQSAELLRKKHAKQQELEDNIRAQQTTAEARIESLRREHEAEQVRLQREGGLSAADAEALRAERDTIIENAEELLGQQAIEAAAAAAAATAEIEVLQNQVDKTSRQPRETERG